MKLNRKMIIGTRMIHLTLQVLVLVVLIGHVHLFQIAHTSLYTRNTYHNHFRTNIVAVSSSRNLNENGERVSDLYSALTSVDSAADVLYRNETEATYDDNNDDDDCDSVSVMTSVTHWSDIMRQDSPWLHVNGDNNSSSLQNTATEDTIISTTSSESKRLDDTSTLTQEDLDQIEQYWNRLMPTVNYLGTVQVAQIYKALQVAYHAHRGQMRKSGEPFIIHVRYISSL
jgi:hypothetical protein